MRPQPDRHLRQHAALVDEAISRVASDLALPSSIALIAVGGYGRGFLFPSSDVDVLVLQPSEAAPPEHTALIEQFVALLWDVGLEPGISVRTVEECVAEANRDITVSTTLLEMRPIWGNAKSAARLQKALRASRDVLAFVDAKIAEQHARHAKHNDVALNLEPNIKESPGGLRDLHTVMWIARASGVAEDWRALASAGQLTAVETRAMMRHRRVLIDLRIRLHLLAGRREDRLVFDHQNAMATQLGYVDGKTKRASEQLMARYYLSARAVWQLNSILIVNLRERIAGRHRLRVSPIDDHFELVNGNVAAIDESCFERDPRNLLRAFLALQRVEQAEFFAPSTLRAIWRAVPRIDSALRADPEANAIFLQMLQSDRLTFTLRRMSRYGLLGRFLPSFGRIVGLMQHDLFHVYTVDEHILMVLRNMRRLVLPKFAHEFPYCHSLARDFDKPYLLYLACLFHDIAKGRGGDHSHLGVADARRFCRRLALPKADEDLVAWLVKMHLVMSSTAQKQDLSDPEVISQFAVQVGNERRLVALYLLTVADVRGTSPHVWNAWKARLLEELFRATHRLLRGDAAPNAFWVEHRREEALALLQRDAPPPLWHELDASYFQRFSPHDIAWHAKVGADAQDPSALPVVDARCAEDGDFIAIVVFAADRSGLFARLTAALETLRLDIQSARITTTNKGLVIDGFEVVTKSSPTEVPALLSRIRKTLAAACTSHEPLDKPSQVRLSRQQRHQWIEPQVKLRGSRSTLGGTPQRLELSVACTDRPGLLSAIARFLLAHDLSIVDARVNTLGARAEDNFVIENVGSGALDQDALSSALVNELSLAIKKTH